MAFLQFPLLQNRVPQSASSWAATVYAKSIQSNPMNVARSMAAKAPQSTAELGKLLRGGGNDRTQVKAQIEESTQGRTGAPLARL